MKVPLTRERTTILSYVPALVGRLATAEARSTGQPWAHRFAAAVLIIDIAGFTPLTALLEHTGQQGVEELTSFINAYWGAVIDLILDRGGDVAKFAGDALLVVWPALEEDLATATGRAAECGLAIAAQFNDVTVLGEHRLSCRQAVVCGDVVAAAVGGVDDRWRFVIGGAAFQDLESTLATAQAAEVVVSASAWRVLGDSAEGERRSGGAVRLTALRADLPACVTRPLEDAEILDTAPLRGYVPDPVLPRLDADHGEWLAEFRRVTVLFANIIGLSFEAENALAALHRAAAALESVVHRYEGCVKELTIDDKGTTLVAVFGLPPAAHEDDPIRGLRAAEAIQAELARLGLAGRVGIATGRVFCGSVGSARRRDYALMGEPMPRAARLAAAIEAGEVVCDEGTFQGAQARMVLERLPRRVLKGIDDPVTVFRPAPSHQRATSAARLIGRRAEHARLQAALEATRAGRGACVVLEGEPGIGKTHLIEVLASDAASLGMRSLVGTADAIERSTSYYAWRPIFAKLLGVDPNELSAGERRKRGATEISVDPSVSHLLPLLNTVLPLDLPDNEITAQMTGQVRARNTQQLLAQVLGSAAAAAPLLVVLDDGHWLDSASWALARHVAEEQSGIFLLLSTRSFTHALPPDYEQLLERPGVERLRLESLSAEDAVGLFCRQLGVTRVSEELATYVGERAEGNPFFIEELARTLRDGNFLEVVHGECRVAATTGDLSALNLPGAVQGVVTGRIDRLEQAEQLTLKVAAVIGRSFSREVLQAIYPVEGDRQHLDEYLAALEAADLCRLVSSAPDGLYTFKHSITQQVAYELLPFAQRRRLHQALAEWYERRQAPDFEMFFPLLAENFRLAGQTARALEYLERAGDHALLLYQNEEAIRFFRDALKLADDVEPGPERARRAHWELQLGQALVNLSRYDEGRQHLESGLALLDDRVPADLVRQVPGLLGQLSTQVVHGVARSHFVGRAAKRRDVLLAASRAYARLAEVYYFNQQTVPALYAAFRTLNAAEGAGPSPELAEGYATVGALIGLIPLHGLAQRYLQRALEMATTPPNLLARPFVWVAAAFYYAGCGDWLRATRLLRDLVALSARIGDHRRWQDGTWNLICAQQFQGDFLASRTLIEEFRATADRLRDPRFQAGSLLAAGHSHQHLGEYDLATDCLDQAAAILEAHPTVNDASFQLESLGLRAVLHLRCAAPDRALRAAERALDVARAGRPSNWGSFPGYAGPAEVYLALWEQASSPAGLEPLAAEACKVLGQYASVFPIGKPRHALASGAYHWLKGNAKRAERAWRDSLTAAEALGMRFDQALAHYELGRHLDPQDDGRVDHLERAARLFTACGARHHLERVEQALGPRASV